MHDGKQFVQQDVLVPWQIEGTTSENKGETFLRWGIRASLPPKVCHISAKMRPSINHTHLIHFRFYHVFVEGEFEELVRLSGGCTLESIVNEQGNWIAVLRKKDE